MQVDRLTGQQIKRLQANKLAMLIERLRDNPFYTERLKGVSTDGDMHQTLRAIEPVDKDPEGVAADLALVGLEQRLGRHKQPDMLPDAVLDAAGGVVGERREARLRRRVRGLVDDIGDAGPDEADGEKDE